MPTLEYNFSDRHLDLIRDTGQTGDAGDMPSEFDPTIGDYIRMSIFGSANNFIDSFYSNLSGFDDSIVEVNYDDEWGTQSFDGDLVIPQLRIYKTEHPDIPGSDKLFVKPNEVMEERNFEGGNYQLKFEFLHNSFNVMGSDIGTRKYFFVKEISASRKEVRLIARNGVDAQISISEDEIYNDQYDLVLALPAGQNIPILNYMIDIISDPSNPSLILKLYNAVSGNVGHLTQVTIEREIFTTQTEDIMYKVEDYIDPLTGEGLGKDGLLSYEDVS